MDGTGPAVQDRATLDRCVRLGHGFADQERSWVLRRLAGLEPRLRPFAEQDISLLISVKERETPSQRITLEAVVGHLPVMVATSRHAVLGHALAEVRDDLARQLRDAKTRREPVHGRHH